MKILDGHKISNEILNIIKDQIASESSFNEQPPKLATILVGENHASNIYINNKHEACKKVGIQSKDIRMDLSTTTEQLVEQIEDLNVDQSVSGILVQLPLPNHIDKYMVISAISPLKDVDGIHPYSLGDNFYGQSTFIPCTPKGILRLLDGYGLDDHTGKNVTIIGASEIVVKPLAILFSKLNATVTLCNEHTRNISDHIKKADILVCATGKLNTFDCKDIKQGSIVIDVGIIRDENNNIRGDVDFDIARNIASYITPVPGGVGPMTVAMLIENTVLAALLQSNINGMQLFSR